MVEPTPLKHMIQFGSFPQFSGLKKKTIWNNHLVNECKWYDRSISKYIKSAKFGWGYSFVEGIFFTGWGVSAPRLPHVWFFFGIPPTAWEWHTLHSLWCMLLTSPFWEVARQLLSHLDGWFCDSKWSCWPQRVGSHFPSQFFLAKKKVTALIRKKPEKKNTFSIWVFPKIGVPPNHPL